MSKTYVIGDVHGEFDTLIKLIDSIPKDTSLVFVGDLIDRGEKSKQVVQFVRKNNHSCVLGNHEWMMMEYGRQFLQEYPNNTNASLSNMWLQHGGIETLMSYGLMAYDEEENTVSIIKDEASIKCFKSDIAWFETLPLYIHMQNTKRNDKDIVISHASMADAWSYHDKKEKQTLFEEYALWNRKPPINAIKLSPNPHKVSTKTKPQKKIKHLQNKPYI